MDWVKCRLHDDGQYILEQICSRLASDIHQFNRLPVHLRWGVVGSRRFKLHRHDHRALAAVYVKNDQNHGPGNGDLVLQLRAEERCVDAECGRVEFPSMRITASPVDTSARWCIESAANGLVDAELWQVSEAILHRLFFAAVDQT